jgi:hypothetical protein
MGDGRVEVELEQNMGNCDSADASQENIAGELKRLGGRAAL